MKIYELKLGMTVECPEELREQIRDELMDALVDVAEKHEIYLGGWLDLKEYVEEEDESV